MRRQNAWLAACLIVVAVACDPRDQYLGGGTNLDIDIWNVIDGDGDKTIRGNPEEACGQFTDSADRDECLREVQVGISSRGLRVNDCDDTDNTVYPGAPEICDGQDNQCPGDGGYGQIDEGLANCRWCDDDGDCASTEGCDIMSNICEPVPCTDSDACTQEVVTNHACTHSPIVGCCNDDSDCTGGDVCTSQTATVAGTCVECMTNAECEDGLFCNGVESCGNNVCQMAQGGACSSPLVCDEQMDACVGCLDDDDCADDEICDVPSAMCVPLACDDNDVCTSDAAVMHTCDYAPIPLCCHGGPTGDAECASFRPATLPQEYLWGCSGAPVPPTNLYYCTSCNDADGDGWCGANEVCGNGFDDDGDGMTDEAQCVSPPAPDAGVSDSGSPDSGTPDTGMDAGVADAGSGGCMHQTCASGFYWACDQCAPYVDQHGRTPYGASGAGAGPQGDGTADDWDDDGDGYCEVSPCLGSRDPSRMVGTLLGGDCDDDPSDGTQFVIATPQGSYMTDGSNGNHPGGQDWCESAPGFDNDCDGVPNDGCL